MSSTNNDERDATSHLQEQMDFKTMTIAGKNAGQQEQITGAVFERQRLCSPKYTGLWCNPGGVYLPIYPSKLRALVYHNVYI